MLNYREVLGYRFVNNTMDELVREVTLRINHEQKTFIVTANPEIITYAESHAYYEEILKNSDYIIPDGIGIVIASRLKGTPLQERLAGFDLMYNLLKLSNQHHYKVYLLGTKRDIIDLSALNIKKAFPNLEIVGYHHGYFHNDKPIIEEIKRTQPDLVFVGLGFPKQEQWISHNLEQFQKGIFIGVGGCLNIWGGVNKRAPRFMRTLYLEWLYRLIKEPSRSRRMLAIPVFLKRVLRNEFNK